ncbi:MAG: NUDIX hydrolase [Clostridia bacterium]|nr:NUDIX hydrolase [Clostridia bacterium]
MDIREKTISSEQVYDGRIIKLNVDRVICPNGREATREIVRHPGGVAVVPVDKDGYVYMVRQYRVPYDTIMLEVPAGKLDKGEEIEAAAARELREETGLTAKNMVFMGNFYPSVGFCDENLRMYLATDLSQGETDPDDDEFLNIEKLHIDRLVDMIMNNEIKDGKTIAAILKAKILLGR